MMDELNESETRQIMKLSFVNRLKSKFSKFESFEKNKRASEYDLFRSSFHATELRKDGVICFPLLDENGLNAIKDIYNKAHSTGKIPALLDGIQMTIWHNDTEYKLSIREGLEKILTPYFDSIFKNYRALSQQFIVKLSGVDTTFPVHQDWSIVNETNFFSLNIWIPLHDVDEKNGAMWIVKGSHKLNQPIRGAGNLFPNYFSLLDELKPYMTSFPMKAGEALLFYHSTIHGSPANIAEEPRIIVQASVVPEKAPMEIYFQPLGTKTVEIHNPEDNFNFFYNNIREESLNRPPTAKSSAILENFELNPVSLKAIRKAQQSLK